MGTADVQNGLALCGLHRPTFDRFLVDVDDDFRVVLSPALRARKDGPLFQQAFLDRHQKPPRLPDRHELRPTVENLQARRRLRPASLWTG